MKKKGSEKAMRGINHQRQDRSLEEYWRLKKENEQNRGKRGQRKEKDHGRRTKQGLTIVGQDLFSFARQKGAKKS